MNLFLPKAKCDGNIMMVYLGDTFNTCTTALGGTEIIRKYLTSEEVILQCRIKDYNFFSFS